MFELQKAIFKALDDDATLTGLIGAVYDSPPQDAAFAYVVIGDDSATDFDDDRTTGLDVTCQIHTWSRAHRGRREVKLIQNRIHAILHRVELSVTGFGTVETFVEFQDTFLDSDGVTFHGVQNLRVVITTT